MLHSEPFSCGFLEAFRTRAYREFHQFDDRRWPTEPERVEYETGRELFRHLVHSIFAHPAYSSYTVSQTLLANIDQVAKTYLELKDDITGNLKDMDYSILPIPGHILQQIEAFDIPYREAA